MHLLLHINVHKKLYESPYNENAIIRIIMTLVYGTKFNERVRYMDKNVIENIQCGDLLKFKNYIRIPDGNFYRM